MILLLNLLAENDEYARHAKKSNLLLELSFFVENKTYKF